MIYAKIMTGATIYIQAFVITFSFGMDAIPWFMMSEVHYLVAYT